MIQNPSSYQRKILEAVVDTDKNIVIQATAGSGKSSTLVAISELIPNNLECCFLAFNKSIVEHLKTKLPSHITCKTSHSFGFSALMSYYKIKFEVNTFKSLGFIQAQLANRGMKPKEFVALQFAMMNAIGMMRMNVTPYDIEAIQELCIHYDLAVGEKEIPDLIEVCQDIDTYNAHFSKKANKIDFNEMLYCALDEKIKMKQFDVLLIDEVQDLNKAQLSLVDKLIKPNGRIIAVGDKNQSIYGFAGSHGGSFEHFANRPNTITLPLSISYRCSRAIVNSARDIYPEIEVWDKAQEGEVREGSISEISNNDFIICRNNRPLIFLYLKLLERGQIATIIGRDIEIALKRLIAKVSGMSIEAGLEKLNDDLFDIEQELLNKGKNPVTNRKYIQAYEHIQVIDILSRGCGGSMDSLEKRIEQLFVERPNAAKLMSIHKSKGLEAERVFIIESFEGKKLIPSPYALLEHEKISERNISFVGCTRAKTSLIKIEL